MNNKAILDLVINAVKEIAEALGTPELKDPVGGTRLYGGEKGTLDSLNLVRLITDLEEKISETFGKEIIIADERAMSQKTSPFKNVQSLADYILLLLAEE